MGQWKSSFEDLRVKDLTRSVSIPIPAAVLGVLVSFILGCMLGGMMSHKKAASGHGHDEQRQRMKELKKHHHHGDGPPCRCKRKHHRESESDE